MSFQLIQAPNIGGCIVTNEGFDVKMYGVHDKNYF